jgi:hypothetical protein
MAYLLSSRRPDGGSEYRWAEDIAVAYRVGRMAIGEGETCLHFIAPPDHWPMTEADIRKSIAARASYRAAYAQAGLPDPYRGAPL